MAMREFFKWGASSLVGNIVLSALFFSLPLTVIGLILNYVEGSLTWEWGGYVVFYCVLGGVAGGVILWFAITSPLITRKKRS
jgi:hypothetical protein